MFPGSTEQFTIEGSIRKSLADVLKVSRPPLSGF